MKIDFTRPEQVKDIIRYSVNNMVESYAVDIVEHALLDTQHYFETDFMKYRSWDLVIQNADYTPFNVYYDYVRDNIEQFEEKLGERFARAVFACAECRQREYKSGAEEWIGDDLQAYMFQRCNVVLSELFKINSLAEYLKEKIAGASPAFS